MTTLIYTFTFSTETKQATKTGNISTQEALHLLLDILSAELQKESHEPKEAASKNSNSHLET
jgi:hypothetical protein